MGLLAKAENIRSREGNIRQKELKLSPPPIPVRELKAEKPKKTKISAPAKEYSSIPEQPKGRIMKIPLFHRTKAPKIREEELATKEELLKEKENILKSMERQIEQKEKSLMGKKNVFEKDIANLMDNQARQEQEFKKRKEQIDREISQKRKELEMEIAKKKEQADNDVSQKRKELEKFINTKGNIDQEISQKRKEFDLELMHKQEQLEQIERLMVSRKNLMKENEALLDDKEKSILEKLEELEATKRELEQDKRDIIAELKKLNKAKADMTEKSKKKDEMRKREEFLKQKESEIKEKEKELETEKTEIEDAEFQKYMAEILREVMAGVKEESNDIIVPNSVLGFVKEQMRKGESVPSIRQSLSRSGWGNDMIDKAIDEVYIRTELEKEGIKPAQIPMQKRPSKKQIVADNTQKIYSLLQSARHLVKEHKIDNAKETLTEIKLIYEKLPIEESKKSLLYYDIMELKTDIDLALLD